MFGCVCVCVWAQVSHRLRPGLCSRPNEKCCASLASLIMKLVTEMDEIMAPKATWKKCASPHIPLTGNENGKERRQQGSAITVELIPCVICKVAEEIEKATGKNEQFKVEKRGRGIEKNLPSFRPITSRCGFRVKLYSSTWIWLHSFTVSIRKFLTVLGVGSQLNCNTRSLFSCGRNPAVCCSYKAFSKVLWRLTELVPLRCLFEWMKQKALACNFN